MVEGQTARIDDPRIAAERSDRFPFGIEAENRAIASAVGAARAGDTEFPDPCFYRTMNSSHGART